MKPISLGAITATRLGFLPNYEVECEVCGQTPTVEIQPENIQTGLCGPCTWGEADTIDPENW